MLQDIDLSYDRSGALATSKDLNVAGSLAVAGSLTVGGTLTVGGVAISGAAGTATTAPAVPLPSDHGLVAWSADPNYASATSVAGAGTLYLAAVYVRAQATVNKLWWIQSAGGASPVAGENWVGLYNSAGTLLASASADAKVASNGGQSVSIASQSLPVGAYWVALLFNAATQPTLARTSGAFSSTNNINLTAATYRYAVAATGLTAMPATITPSSNSLTGTIAAVVAIS